MNEQVTPNPGPERPRGTVPSALVPVVGLVLGASAAVALSAGGLHLLAPPIDFGGARLLVQLAAGGVAVFGGVILLRRRRVLLDDERGSMDPAVRSLRAAGMLMGGLFLVGLLNPPPLADDGAGRAGSFALPIAPAFGSGRGTGEVLDPTTRGGDAQVRSNRLDDEITNQGLPIPDSSSLFTRVRGPMAWLLAGLMTLILFRAVRGKNRSAPEEEEDVGEMHDLDPVASDHVDPIEEGALGYQVPFSAEPITRAYQRLLDALDELGAGREPQEAPYEHLKRAARRLDVQPEPLRTLTRLYVVAEFAGREPTADQRSAAQGALADSLAQLEVPGASSGALS